MYLRNPDARGALTHMASQLLADYPEALADLLDQLQAKVQAQGNPD